MTSTPRTGAPWLRRSNFEQALGVHVLGRRALSHEDYRADPEGWVSKLRTERSGELAAYGLRLVRMPAGQLAKELDLAASVTEDVAAIVKRRNHLAHRWFPEYFPRRGQEGARDSAIRELRELETDLRHRAFALSMMLIWVLRLREDERELTHDDSERVWTLFVKSVREQRTAERLDDALPTEPHDDDLEDFLTDIGHRMVLDVTRGREAEG